MEVSYEQNRRRIKKTGVFYVVTVEGDQPRVRPFSSTAEIDGQLKESISEPAPLQPRRLSLRDDKYDGLKSLEIR